MVGSRVYDAMYRHWAPWDAVGARPDLKALLTSGRIDSERYPTAVDLGCGTGANVVFLAQQGFEAVGVDFSPVALEKAGLRAEEGGVSERCGWVEGDLTAASINDLDGPFDFLVDFGTLDDLKGEDRQAMADLVVSLARPGSVFLEWCFYGSREDLPWISFSGTSKLSHIAPGELENLFGAHFDVEPFSANPERRVAAFLLTRR